MSGRESRAWVEVDLAAVTDNARTVARIAGARLLPVVKANAYGLGAVAVSTALEALDPWGYGVATLEEGAGLFAENCASCHGEDGRGLTEMGAPNLTDGFWIYGGDDHHIFASISEGRANGMPAWGTKLPREQIWKLVAYIRALRTPDEPSPPR